MVILHIMSCTSADKYQNFAEIFSHPEDRGIHFFETLVPLEHIIRCQFPESGYLNWRTFS